MSMDTKILEVITELQAIAQTGLTYAKDEFDIERYQRLMAISAEIASYNSSKKFEQIMEIFSSDVGYKTPQVEVRGAVFKDDKILLIREKSDGLWSLPGGWGDVNFSASENVVNEIKEESGFICEAEKLIAVYDKRRYVSKPVWPCVYKMFFLCAIVGGEAVTNGFETTDVGFFEAEDIPPLSEDRVTNWQIEVCFKHHRSPALKAEFD